MSSSLVFDPGLIPVAKAAAVTEMAPPAGNYFDKYRSRNPIHQLLLASFMRNARALLSAARPRSILEVGCGNGDFGFRLLPLRYGRLTGINYLGTDLSGDQIALARKHYPNLTFLQASIYALPFPHHAFELVFACEFFEHLLDPEAALAEVARVCRRWLLLSVPWEPWWCLLNMARGKYLSAWGNTPGHVQPFSRQGIRDLVRSPFAIVDERTPFPWLMLLARRKN